MMESNHVTFSVTKPHNQGTQGEKERENTLKTEVLKD